MRRRIVVEPARERVRTRARAHARRTRRQSTVNAAANANTAELSLASRSLANRPISQRFAHRISGQYRLLGSSAASVASACAQSQQRTRVRMLTSARTALQPRQAAGTLAAIASLTGSLLAMFKTVAQNLARVDRRDTSNHSVSQERLLFDCFLD